MNSNRLAIRLNKMLASECILGEGLWVEKSKAAWVDIDTDKILVHNRHKIEKFFIQNKPSIIYDFKNNVASIGTDVGLTKYNIQTNDEVLLNDVSNTHNIKEYRSNDGGFCGNHQLLSFMHRNDPLKNLGFVYLIKDKSFYLIDSTLHIPNSFIEIEPSKILISDSLMGKIWLYQLDNFGNIKDKSLWAKLESGKFPDGGCLVGNFVFVTVWDGAAIAVYSKSGDHIKNLALPIIRPTNCKFDIENLQLWVTSAREGLSVEQLSLYPFSGNTFVYDLDLGY